MTATEQPRLRPGMERADVRSALSDVTDEALLSVLADEAASPSQCLTAAAGLADRAPRDASLRRRIFDEVLPDPCLHISRHLGMTTGRVLLAELIQTDRDMVASELPALLARLEAAGVVTDTWTGWLGLA